MADKEEESSCCDKFCYFLNVLSQIPIVSVVTAVGAFICFGKLDSGFQEVQDGINQWFDLSFATTAKWVLAAIVIIDIANAVVSFFTSEWINKCCCSNCGKCMLCFTSYGCWLAQWLLFIVSYILAFAAGMLLVINTGMVVIGFVGDSICQNPDAELADKINEALLNLKTWVCDDLGSHWPDKLGGALKCDGFPTEIPPEDVDAFCMAMLDTKDVMQNIFAYAFIGFICQLNFGIISRANLVESRLHHKNIKEDNAQEETEMATNNYANTGLNRI